METFPRGRICWHELMTTDTQAAVDFYTRITGWKAQAWADDPAYTLWMNGAVPVGGLMALPEQAKLANAPPNWMMYVAVQDADGTVFRAEALGANSLSGVQAVPNVGRFAVIQDPQGAVFAVLQPAADVPGHDGEPKVGEFSWHELVTTDYDSAMSFYSALFGWSRGDAMDMGPMGIYQIYRRAGRDLGGIYNKPPEMPAPPHWLCYIKVPSADEAVRRVSAARGQVVNGPMDVPGGDRIAQAMDPQGAMFAVHSAPPKPAAQRAPTAPKPAAKKPAARKVTKKAKKKATKKAAKKKSAAKKPAKKSAGRKKKR